MPVAVSIHTVRNFVFDIYLQESLSDLLYSFEGRLRRRLAYKHFNKSSISQPSYLNLEAFSTSLGLHGCYYKEYLRITRY